MKKLIAFVLLIFFSINPSIAAATEAESQIPVLKNKSKILIVYYSWSGNTQKAAEEIQRQTGGELFQITTTQVYPQDRRELTAQVKQEIAEHYKPVLKDKVDNIAQYDTIFIGSPNWWGTIAPAVHSFLTAYDLSGKNVIPFISHGGGGKQKTIAQITDLCAGCQISPTPWIGYKDDTTGLPDWIKTLELNQE